MTIAQCVSRGVERHELVLTGLLVGGAGLDTPGAFSLDKKSMVAFDSMTLGATAQSRPCGPKLWS